MFSVLRVVDSEVQGAVNVIRRESVISPDVLFRNEISQAVIKNARSLNFEYNVARCFAHTSVKSDLTHTQNFFFGEFFFITGVVLLFSVCQVI